MAVDKTGDERPAPARPKRSGGRPGRSFLASREMGASAHRGRKRSGRCGCRSSRASRGGLWSDVPHRDRSGRASLADQGMRRWRHLRAIAVNCMLSSRATRLEANVESQGLVTRNLNRGLKPILAQSSKRSLNEGRDDGMISELQDTFRAAHGCRRMHRAPACGARSLVVGATSTVPICVDG